MDNLYMEQGLKEDKRINPDRRKQPTPFISRYTFAGGRRSIIRRKTEKKKYVFVDLYNTRLLVPLLSLMILSMTDACLTIFLIKNGPVIEANPVLAFYLEYGSVPFILVKSLISIMSILLFCMFKNFRIAKIAMTSAIILYFSIIAYEIGMLYNL